MNTTGISVDNPVIPATPDDAATDPPTKSRRIPVSEINAAAAKLQQESRIPTKPGDKVNDEQLQRWLDLLTPQMWDKLMIYVNRIYPRINRKMSDPDQYKYIDVITKEALETSGGTVRKHLVQNHGGGKYGLYINDTSRTGMGRQCVFEAFCTIPFDECEPKLNLEEVELHNKENAGYVSYLQNKGILDAQKRIIKPNTGIGNNGIPTPGSNSDSGTIGAIGQLFTQFANTYKQLNPAQKEDLGTKGINELFLERLKQEDPNKQLTALTAMMGMLKDMIPKADTSNSLSMKDVMTMMNDSHTKQIEMFKMLLEQKNSASEDSSDLDKLIKWKTALPELFGKGRGHDAEKSTAEIVVDAVKEVGLPILGIVSQIIQNKTGAVPIIAVNAQQAQEQVRQAQGGNRQPNQPQPYQHQYTQHVPQQPQQVAAPSNVTTMPSPNDATNATDAIEPDKGMILLQTYLVNYGMMIVNALKNGQTGVDVGQYIKGMAPMVGEDVYEVIKAQGKEKLMLAMKSIPEFWAQTGGLYGEKRIDEFVDEFMEFEEILAEEEREDRKDNENKKPVA